MGRPSRYSPLLRNTLTRSIFTDMLALTNFAIPIPAVSVIRGLGIKLMSTFAMGLLLAFVPSTHWRWHGSSSDRRFTQPQPGNFTNDGARSRWWLDSARQSECT